MNHEVIGVARCALRVKAAERLVPVPLVGLCESLGRFAIRDDVPQRLETVLLEHNTIGLTEPFFVQI